VSIEQPEFFIHFNGKDIPIGRDQPVRISTAAKAMRLPTATLKQFHRDGLIPSVRVGNQSLTTINNIERALIGMMQTPKKAEE
jgi:hypothetical protein